MRLVSKILNPNLVSISKMVLARFFWLLVPLDLFDYTEVHYQSDFLKIWHITGFASQLFLMPLLSTNHKDQLERALCHKQ